MIEAIESRILGALQLVDAASGQRIAERVNISSDNATFLRNRSNLYVITDAGELSDYTASFEAPNDPALGSVSVELQISDPSQKYLSRRAIIALPRDAQPDNSADGQSVFQPITLELFRNVQAKTLVTWSLVRVSALNDSGNALIGAFIQVVRVADDQILGRAITDLRGEALVIIPGVPITEFSDSDQQDENDEEEPAVLVADVNVRTEISIAASAIATPQWPVNPDQLQVNHSSQIQGTANTSLRTGRTEVVRFVLS